MAKPSLTVLQVIPEISAGGAERTTLEITEAVRSIGGRALVASEGGRMEAELAALGGELIRLPVASKSPFTVRANFSRLAKLIRKEGVDIIHARSRAPAWSALWAARKTGIPYITTYHGAYHGESALKRLYNSAMARGDMVIANSEYIADHVRTVHRVEPERLATIPRGVNTDIFDPALADFSAIHKLREKLCPEGRKLLILPGRLTSWKGQEVVIDAIAQLSDDERAQIMVQLIGDPQGRDDYVAGLKSRISGYGLEHFVQISGHFSDMPTLYAASDLVLAPSVRPEAFGRIAIEAEAMARPIIASAHGGQLETVQHGETGWLVEPGDASDLARAIAEYLSLSETRRNDMGRAARSFVIDRFTTKNLQTATLKVYEQAMAKRANADG